MEIRGWGFLYTKQLYNYWGGIKMTIVNSGTKTIEPFLKDDRYFVPKYQRGVFLGRKPA